MSRFSEGERLQVIDEAGEQLRLFQGVVDVFGRRLLSNVHNVCTEFT